MISICVPTRGRPGRLKQFSQSVFDTLSPDGEVEIRAYVDLDDNSYDNWGIDIPGLFIHVAPRTTIAESWNYLVNKSLGDIYMMAGDDLTFVTPDWDLKVMESFDEFDDKIVVVHGDDGPGGPQGIATHPFVHKNWVKVLGYFAYPEFTSGYVDNWVSDIGIALGRIRNAGITHNHEHIADEVFNDVTQKRSASAALFGAKTPVKDQEILKLKDYIDSYKEKQY